MRYAAISLPPRQAVIEHCETCSLTHVSEETNCVASRNPGAALTANPYDAGGHCRCWWDGGGCCWCGDDPCAAAVCALG